MRFPAPITSSVFALSLGLLVGQAAWAEPPELITDRPDATESSAIVPRGSVQIETGWLFTRDDARDDEGGELETTEAPGTLVRLGLSERFELRLAWAGSVRQELRGPSGRATTSGSGDAEAGFKVRLSDGGDKEPAVALLVATSVPVGDDALTSDRYDPYFRFALEWDLPGRYAFGTNLGMAWASEATELGTIETSSTFEYTATLGIDLAGPIGGFAELFGEVGLDDGAAPAHSFAAGFTFLALPNLQFDLYGGVGLNDSADDSFIGAGFSWRLPR